MTIHQNLRELRQLSGLTQETVASRVGLTRQAISGYESGRTQPDLEMLGKLADVYQADLSDVLYGKGREQKKHRTLKRAAIAVLSVLLALTLADSCLLFAADRLYPISDGTTLVTDTLRPVIEKHFALTRAWETLQRAASAAAILGCVILAVLLGNVRRLRPFWRDVCFFGYLILGLILCTAPFAPLDSTHGLVDYLMVTLVILPPAFLLLVYRALLGLIRNRRGKA